MCDKAAFRDPIYQHMHEMMIETQRVLKKIEKDRAKREGDLR